MAAKPSTPTTKRARSPKLKIKPREPNYNEIAPRAYLIHVEEGTTDELANWLRAERELAAARRSQGAGSAIGGVVRLGCRPS